MKTTTNAKRRSLLTVMAITAIVTIAFVFTACPSPTGGSKGGSSGGSSGGTSGGSGSKADYTANNINDLATWLAAQTANTAAKPYRVKLNVSDLGGRYDTAGSTGKALADNSTKYVSLDLSGSTLTSIVVGAFAFCANLTSINIPDSVTSIGGAAFANCTSLTSVTIPRSVTSIGEGAFLNCTSLTSVTIPRSVTSIGESAFSDCTGMTSVTISDSVTSIEEFAFSRCTSLTSVTISRSVTSIGQGVFTRCTSLTSVTFATGSNIADANFGNNVFPEGSIGNGGNTLKTAYNTGKAGTYKRAADGDTWTKQ